MRVAITEGVWGLFGWIEWAKFFHEEKDKGDHGNVQLVGLKPANASLEEVLRDALQKDRATTVSLDCECEACGCRRFEALIVGKKDR